MPIGVEVRTGVGELSVATGPPWRVEGVGDACFGAGRRCGDRRTKATAPLTNMPLGAHNSTTPTLGEPSNLLLLSNSTHCEVTAPMGGKGPGSHGCAPGTGSVGVPHPWAPVGQPSPAQQHWELLPEPPSHHPALSNILQAAPPSLSNRLQASQTVARPAPGSRSHHVFV